MEPKAEKHLDQLEEQEMGSRAQSFSPSRLQQQQRLRFLLSALSQTAALIAVELTTIYYLGQRGLSFQRMLPHWLVCFQRDCLQMYLLWCSKGQTI